MNARAQRRSGSSQGGFTLIELIVVMGILSGFLVMLVSLVDSGLTMFRDGETSQVLADRGARAQQVIRDELSRLRGSSTGRDRTQVEDRLVVQMLPNGNLVIAGRQEVKVNQELRELRVAGIIRPEDIQMDNTIPYEKIAEARITYGGRGQLSRTQERGYGEDAMDIILPY